MNNFKLELANKFEEESSKKKLMSIMKDQTSKTHFFNFLKSKQYQNLLKTIDSDQITKDFTKAMDEGFSLEDIMTQYEKYKTSEITFEQVAERRAEILKTRKLLK